MDSIKDDNYYLKSIKKSFDRITSKTNGISYMEFYENMDIQEITKFHLIQISENAKKISDEYIQSKKEISWGDIYGLRNRIVHDYGNVILDIVYETLMEDIPEVKKQLFEEKNDDYSSFLTSTSCKSCTYFC